MACAESSSKERFGFGNHGYNDAEFETEGPLLHPYPSYALETCPWFSSARFIGAVSARVMVAWSTPMFIAVVFLSDVSLPRHTPSRIQQTCLPTYWPERSKEVTVADEHIISCTTTVI